MHGLVQIATDGGWIMVFISVYSLSFYVHHLTLIGASVRSAVTPPVSGSVPNIHRKPNPFSLSEESDWVSLPHSASGQLHGKVGEKTLSKPPLPPRRRKGEAPRQQGLIREDVSGSESDGGETSSAQVPRSSPGVPPPIPRKPDSLSRRRDADNASVLESPAYLPNRPKRPEIRHPPANHLSSREVGNRVTSLKGGIRPPDKGNHYSDSAAVSSGQASSANTENLLDEEDEKIEWNPLVP